MRVAGERTADAETIGASLLLIDPPLPGLSFLSSRQLLNQLGPLDARLDVDRTVLRVERQESIHRARVDEDGRVAELLPAHRVSAAGDANGFALRTHAHDGCAQLLDG